MSVIVQAYMNKYGGAQAFECWNTPCWLNIATTIIGQDLHTSKNGRCY